MDSLLPLECLQAGEQGEVVEIRGKEGIVAHLAERGLKPGATLQAIVPGNPFLFRVDDTRLSLRADDQVEIVVLVKAS